MARGRCAKDLGASDGTCFEADDEMDLVQAAIERNERDGKAVSMIKGENGNVATVDQGTLEHSQRLPETRQACCEY